MTTCANAPRNVSRLERYPKHCFVTVGSTSFSALIQATLSRGVLLALGRQGVGCVTMQKGSSALPLQWSSPEGMQVNLVDYLDAVDETISSADLVISHAGAGSILAALRGPLLSPASPTRLIVVANPALLDNHQDELADALIDLGLIYCASPENLATVISSIDWSKTLESADLPASNVKALMQALDY